MQLSEKRKLIKQINPILEDVYKASRHGVWEGIDGVKNIIESDRMHSLKQQDSDQYQVAMSKCFEQVLKGASETEEQHLIVDFIHEYKRLCKAIARRNPKIFANYKQYQEMLETEEKNKKH